LRLALAAAAWPLSGCGGDNLARTRFPGPLSDFEPVANMAFPARRIGPAAGRAVVVLHELPGMTKDDLALARGLGRSGFNTYVPLLFGSPEQDDIVSGYKQACEQKLFECGTLSTRNPIQGRIGQFCEEAARQSGHPVGAIGMCLTGILPLALFSRGVGAAVLCQPTVPFTVSLKARGIPSGDQIRDLGLDPGDLKAACDADVPFLVVHYVGDKRCPPGRVEKIREVFAGRVATIDLGGDHHSSLSAISTKRRSTMSDYLNVRPGTDPGAATMRARGADRPARPAGIGADRLWQAM
jgi:dienelactone hydrolase